MITSPTVKRSGSGFHTFELADYREFIEVVVPKFRDNRDYVWRGCRDPNWHLISSLTRKLQSLQKGLTHREWIVKCGHLTAQQILNYLMQLRGVEMLNTQYLNLLDKLYFYQKLAGQNRSFTEILNYLTLPERGMIFELFAKGQHHELATPLLDWTRSPFIALFFAFRQGDQREDDEGHRVLYALNRYIIEKHLPPAQTIAHDGILFIESMAERNPRLIGQSGLFTFSPSYLSIEKWVVDTYKEQPKLPVLLRFLIRNKKRKDCISDLGLMNIDSRSLFPDFVGAAQASNYLLESE